MKRTFAIFAILCSFGLLAPAQNLVQNPSFENLPDWDEHWLLSLTNPSTPTAVATPVISDAHEGTTSVELSNTLDKEWTYFYTDVLTAPIRLLANRTYEVRGWVKSVEEGKSVKLSIFWDGSGSSQVIYSGNPNPVSQPDWFMVETTITPTADFNDGYLRLGIQTDKLGGSVVGRLLLDDFSVTLVPDGSDADIWEFSFPGQILPESVDPDLAAVHIEMPFGTDLFGLAPDHIALSAGASVSPSSGVAQDFRSPVIYTVTAQDGTTTRDWTVTVTTTPPSTATDLTSFTLPELIAPATINKGVQLVLGRVPYGTDLKTLVPGIEVSPGASIDPVPGVATDFTNPVSYIVVAQDGTTFQNWVVAVLMEPNTETDIISFEIPELLAPATINTALHTVVGTVPFGTDLTALVPVIEMSGGASSNPLSGAAVDFSSPVIYTVTADDGTTMQDWTVTITAGAASTETDLTSFTLAELAVPATIDDAMHAVTGEVPYGTDLTNLVPAIEVSSGATINPASGVAADFSSTVIYTVTAQDGSTTQDWEVSIQVLPNTATEITSFQIPELAVPATINNVLNTVVGQVPYGTDLSALVPAIDVSAGAVISPLSGAAMDFTSPVTYTITAEDGVTVQDWVVTLQVLPNTETDITGFTLSAQTGPATIDKLGHTVDIEVFFGTNLAFLTPNIALSAGATIDPQSGISRDFTSDLSYTATAEDGVTVQVWTVTVALAPARTETDITAFSIPQLISPAVIDNNLHTVSGTVAYGTNLTARVPTIAVSPGATINPGSGTVTDLSSPVTYTVTAEDGTTQDWLVSIQALPNTETDITDFSIPELISPAAIDYNLHTVSGTVAYGTDLTARVPTIAVSPGATINPGSGTVTDLSSPVIYTVTAEDGTTTQEWLVTLQALPNTETDITTFSLTEQTGASTINRTDHTIDIEVVSGTDLSSLVPTIAVSPGATVDPADGVSRDFTDAVEYLVTAEDGITTQNWTVSVAVESTVGIRTNAVEAISIFPNPASDFLHVELDRETHVRLHDLMGKLCYSQDRVNGDLSINVSEFKRGIYIVSLYWEDGSLQQRKIVLQ